MLISRKNGFMLNKKNCSKVLFMSEFYLTYIFMLIHLYMREQKVYIWFGIDAVLIIIFLITFAYLIYVIERKV